MRRPMRTAVAIGLALCCALTLAAGPWGLGRSSSVGTDGAAQYWTWDRLEPDTVASAWLLTRHLCAPVEIRLVPRGEHSSAGTPFDIPLAELSRTRTASTFHVLRERLGIDDPGVLALERLIDEIEITGWEELPSEEAAKLDRELRALIESAERPEDALLSGTTYLDRLHASLVPHD